MANDSKVFSETDLFSTIFKSDYSVVQEEKCSWRYLAKTYFNNSKPLRNSISNLSINDSSFENYDQRLLNARMINKNQIFKAQNSNAPWLFNVLKKKFHRSRKYKNDRELSRETETISTISFAEELLNKPISSDGRSGRWIISERDVVFPLVNNFDRSTSVQYNVSRAISSSTSPIPFSTDNSLHLHHYHYDFQSLEPLVLSSSSVTNDHPPAILIEEPNTDNPVDFPSIVSVVETYCTNNRQEIELISPSSLLEVLEPVSEDLQLMNDNSTIQKGSKRAKSASARSPRRTVSSNPNKREKRRNISTKKKKYYEEHLLSREEMELREALRLLDLDNIGFFPPTELHKVFKEIGLDSQEIEKIERCLPLDDDGHYSIDNLIKLFLGSKK